MTNDELCKVIALLERKCDEKRQQSIRETDPRKSSELFGMARGFSFALGALESYLSDE